MTREPSQIRPGDLTSTHFLAHPVWTWAEEDDESMIVPVEFSGALPDDHDALFVASRLVLHDGTELQGSIAVRLYDKEVYLVSLPRSDGKFLDVPLQPQLQALQNIGELEHFLKRPSDAIFPIAYFTPYLFRDGAPLVGQIAKP